MDGEPTDERAERDEAGPTDGPFVEMSVEAAGDGAELVDGEQATSAGGDRQTAVVPKRSYCERCEFLSAPPAVRCTNPGTEIRELVDTEHFRVTDCPVVERRGEVEGLEFDVEASKTDP